MQAKKIKAVIFDCDGTLVDSEVLGGKAMHEVAQSYGCTLPFDVFIHQFTGRSMALNIDTLNQYSPTPMPQNFAAEVRAAMAQKFAQELTEIPGAKALLTQLRQRGLPMAVATNGPRFKAEQTLGLTGLLGFFQDSRRGYDTLFSAYEHDAFKPQPQLFLLAAQRLGVEPQCCAALEDSYSGLQAASAAGMQVFSLAHLHALPQALDPEPIYLTRLLQLLDHL